MLELTFLGTGSGIPTKRRNHASIWLRYEDTAMLWDCGEGTQRQLTLAKINFMKIDRIFITHWHADHWAGIIGLMQTMNLENRKKPLYIYGPDAERFVGDILDLDYWGPKFRVIARDVPSEGSEITSVFKTNDFEILSTPVSHTVPAVAYCLKENDVWNVDLKKATEKFGLKQGPLVGKLKSEGQIVYKEKRILLEDVGILKKGSKIVYTGDTKPCKNIVVLAKGADILIHDATFVEDVEDRMHTGAKDAGQTAKQAGVQKLILTHLSRRYTDPKPILEEAKKYFHETVVAEDFMSIELKRK